MSMYLGLLIVLGFFAFGDFLGVKTKAKVSSVFVALMLFLILFMARILPPDLIDSAQLTGLSKMSLAFLVFNMGSTVNLSQLRKEWKVVIMSLLSMGVSMLAIFMVSPLIGLKSAIVSIPIINGGLAATQTMTEAALSQGLTQAAALGTVIFAVQKFVGTVPASRAGLSEARVLLKEYRSNTEPKVTLDSSNIEKNSTKRKQFFYEKHDKYYTTYMTLGIAAATLYVADLIAVATGVSISIWALLLGMTLNQVGLIPPGILDKGKSSGLWMVGSFASLIPSLAKITLDQLIKLSVQTAIIFTAVLVCVYIVMYFLPTWKFIGSRNLSIGIAMSQLLGFPATYLIVNEVATAVAETSDEREYIIKKLSPAFVVSGFVSVTSISILVAGIFAKFV